jgi:hypothetical protein
MRILVVVMLVLGTARCAAQECLDYAACLKWVSDVPSLGLANSVLLAPPYLYMTSHGLGVQVLSLDDPKRPRYLGGVDTPGFSFRLARRGNHLFVADGYEGLQVVDISNPATPVLVGSHPSVYAYDLVARGDFVYLADSDGGLKIFDVSTPAAPRLIGQAITPDRAYGVSVNGDLAFVAASRMGLMVVDISIPESPTIIGRGVTNGSANDTAVAGDYVLVSTDEYGVAVFSTQDPRAPERVGAVEIGFGGKDITYDHGHAYVGSGYAGFNVIDLSDPTHPVLEGRSTIPFAKNIALYGDLAYVTDGMTGERGLSVFDLHHHQSPRELSMLALPARSLDLTLANGLAYICGNVDYTTGDLLIVDPDGPAGPSLAGELRLSSSGYVRDAVVDGGVAVLGVVAGLRTVDVSNPAAPALMASVRADCPVFGLARAGDLVFAANGDCGLAVYDVVDPRAPVFKSRLALAGSTMAVELAGSRAYVGCGDSLCVVDVTDPEALHLVSTTTMPDQVSGLALDGGQVYAACFDAGVQILGLADPDHPIPLGTLPASHFAAEVTVHDGVAYVADMIAGILVFDVGNPVSPVQVGSYSPFDTRALGIVGIAHGPGAVFGVAYETGVISIPFQCQGAAVETEADDGGVGALAIWPNPCNPRAHLAFELADAGPVRLSLYDLAGRLVRTLLDDSLPPGHHEVVWDGRDATGRDAASGMYLARLRYGEEVATARLGLLR